MPFRFDEGLTKSQSLVRWCEGQALPPNPSGGKERQRPAITCHAVWPPLLLLHRLALPSIGQCTVELWNVRKSRSSWSRRDLPR